MSKNTENIGKIYIALGGNLSNQKATFAKALNMLASKGVEIKTVSGLWQSPSWPPGQGHPDYLNAMAEVGFEGKANTLLEIMQEVETQLGRVRSVRNAPRTLDLDIIDFRGEISESDTLTLPHPRLRERGFVLFPLQHIAPKWIDPVTGHTLEHFTSRLALADVDVMKYAGSLRSLAYD